MKTARGAHPALGEEVMTVTEPAEIERLMDVANSDAAVLEDLDQCMNRLRQAQQAKAALASLGSEDLRELFAARRRALGDGTR